MVKYGMRRGHSVPVELAQTELQVEEGQPTKDQHGEVWKTGHTLPMELTQAELQVEEGQPIKDQ